MEPEFLILKRFPQATDGDLPNNFKFSDCSINRISAVLTARSEKCFTSRNSVCGQPASFGSPQSCISGNGIVEQDEQCDCGSNCENDSCCTTNCTFPPGACSPQDPVRFPCCSEDCSIIANGTKRCRGETSCSAAAFCDGLEAACPASGKLA